MKLENPILEVSVAADEAEELSYLLLDAGALAIEERDSGTMTRASSGLVVLVAGFEDAAARLTARELISIEAFSGIDIVEVDDIDEDWQTRWREFFQPVVLDKLLVITPWMSPPRNDRMTIVIDPGQAFGTGGHATTKLILLLLERLSEQGALPERILDVGTGSGILAFAAHRLGATDILGVDIDPASQVAFEENAVRNRIADRVACRVGSAGDVEGEWPLVLANIQIDAFRQVAQEIAARVAPTGSLLVSGLLTDQVAECLSLFPGFDLAQRRDDGEWAALFLKRSE